MVFILFYFFIMEILKQVTFKLNCAILLSEYNYENNKPMKELNYIDTITFCSKLIYSNLEALIKFVGNIQVKHNN